MHKVEARVIVFVDLEIQDNGVDDLSDQAREAVLEAASISEGEGIEVGGVEIESLVPIQ